MRQVGNGAAFYDVLTYCVVPEFCFRGSLIENSSLTQSPLFFHCPKPFLLAYASLYLSREGLMGMSKDLIQIDGRN